MASVQAKVLVIEPEALSRQYLAQALGQLGLSFDARTDDSSLSVGSASGQVHLVIVGLDLDAQENLRRIGRVRQHCRPAALIGVCPHMLPADRIVLLDAGVDFIIEKPFFPEECVSAVQAVLRRLQTVQSPNAAAAASLGQRHAS